MEVGSTVLGSEQQQAVDAQESEENVEADKETDSGIWSSTRGHAHGQWLSEFLKKHEVAP